MNAHRQRVYEIVKNDFLTIKTSSNRQQLFQPLQDRHLDLSGDVDMAHLVFNTMLYGDICEYMLIGNEYSSNYPNAMYEGHTVNQQYVKTIRFVEQLNNYIHQFVTEDFTYYSPFFGMYELLIADLLFRNDKYLDVWTSCSRTTPKVNFSSDCHKCAYLSHR
jgi:hypothetical protein